MFSFTLDVRILLPCMVGRKIEFPAEDGSLPDWLEVCWASGPSYLRLLCCLQTTKKIRRKRIVVGKEICRADVGVSTQEDIAETRPHEERANISHLLLICSSWFFATTANIYEPFVSKAIWNTSARSFYFPTRKTRHLTIFLCEDTRVWKWKAASR